MASDAFQRDIPAAAGDGTSILPLRTVQPGGRRQDDKRMISKVQEVEQEQDGHFLHILIPFTRKEKPTCCGFAGPLTLALSRGERGQRAGMGERDERRGLSPRGRRRSLSLRERAGVRGL